MADVPRDHWQRGVTLKGMSIGFCDEIITAIIYYTDKVYLISVEKSHQ